MSTRQHGSSVEHSGHPTIESTAVLERLREIDPRSENWEAELSAITSGVLDLLLASQVDALADATDPLRDALASVFGNAPHTREVRGWLLGLLALTRWALQRLPSTEELEFLQGGLSWSFLQALEGTVPRSSTELGDRLGTSAPQISRLGRELRARGLVVQRRLGRQAMWELTPRGRQLVRESSRRLSAASEPQRMRAALPAFALPASSNGSNGADASHRAAKRGSASPRHQVAANTNENNRRDVRHVLPHSEGGWRIAKTPDAGTIEVAGTQKEAVARAREIVQNQGGGRVSVHSRNGTTKQINVERR